MRRNLGSTLLYRAFIGHVAVTMVLAASLAAQGAPLQDFLDQIEDLASIHVLGTGTVELKMSSVTRSGSAEYEYWEQGEMFRIRAEAAPRLALMGDVEWSYDGELSLIRFAGRTTPNTSVDAEAPTPIQNPFFSPLAFLHSDESCANCRLSLETLRDAREGMTLVEGPGHRVAIGNDHFSQVYEVKLKEREGMNVPERVSWTSAALGLDVVMDLKHYETVGGLVWPTAIEMRATSSSPDGPSMKSTFYLQLEQVNEDLDPETFRLEAEDPDPHPYP